MNNTKKRARDKLVSLRVPEMQKTLVIAVHAPSFAKTWGIAGSMTLERDQ
jgi:hypothetical protein